MSHSNKSKRPQASVIGMYANAFGLLGAVLTRSVWGAVIGATIGIALALFLTNNKG